MNQIRYVEGFKYQLHAAYTIQTPIRPEKHIATEYIILSTLGVLIIKEGYAWDGPSGPTVDTPEFMRGSLVHDAFYQLMREGYLEHEYREQADDLLRAMCREDGMSWIRAWWVHTAVRNFGEISIDELDPVITAP